MSEPAEMQSAPAKELDWRPVKRTTLSEEIADQLISGILNGRFEFGEKLPPERDLARYLNVGRPSVREALKIMSVIGLVEVRPGEGTFVVDQHSTFVSKAFSWTILLDARTTQEVVEARLAIESESAMLAARRCDASHVTQLEEIAERMEATKGSPTQFAAADVAFHTTIADAAQNVTLARVLNSIQSLLRQWIMQALSTSPAVYEAAIAQHREILAAIESRDEERARNAMRAHLEAMQKLLPQRLPTDAADDQDARISSKLAQDSDPLPADSLVGKASRE